MAHHHTGRKTAGTSSGRDVGLKSVHLCRSLPPRPGHTGNDIPRCACRDAGVRRKSWQQKYSSPRAGHVDGELSWNNRDQLVSARALIAAKETFTGAAFAGRIRDRIRGSRRHRDDLAVCARIDPKQIEG